MAIDHRPAPSRRFFDDEAFQDRLLALLCRDVTALRQTAHLLSANDFRPLRGMRWGRPRWVVAERVLEYFHKFREPIGALVKSDILAYSEEIGLGERRTDELLTYLERLTRQKPVGPEVLVNRVVRYKREALGAQVLQEMVELQASGKLDDAAWNECSRKVLDACNQSTGTVDYFETLPDRQERRAITRHGIKKPLLFIDPLDSMVRAVGRGDLGLLMGPLKRGKSLGLAHIAVAYSVQRYNVLFFTLEDPVHELEDRLDAAITGVPVMGLSEAPKRVGFRFTRFKSRWRPRLKLIDGTQAGMSVGQIEQVLLQERERGFRTDAVIIDYDDEIEAEPHCKERRMEFAQIYRDLRRLAARHQTIVWTGAQTQRKTEELRILTSAHVAEDISKIRKATMTLGLGKGDWGPDSIYLWVVAHKFDRQHVGCNIMTDKRCTAFYDRERTGRAAREYAAGMEEEQDDVS